MKSDDLNAYDKRIFEEVAKLIHGRDPSLDEDAIKQQALNLLAKHARAVSVSLFSLEQSAPKRAELEQLYAYAEGIADVLQNLSTQSDIELRFISGSGQLPNLTRLQQDAKILSEALREGLEIRPPPERHRPEDVTMANLVEEAVNLFEKATGISLNDLPEPKSQKSKNIIHKLNEFVCAYMPEQNKYETESQFKALAKRVSRHRIKRRK